MFAARKGAGGGDFALVLASSVDAPNLASLATAAGWNGSSRLRVTINAGVTVAALSITQTFPGGLEIVNGGTIAGYRGLGGSSDSGAPGYDGGTALYVRVAVTITNNGVIRGGGGGGGAGGWAAVYGDQTYADAGGGAGGAGQGVGYPGTTSYGWQTGDSGGYNELNEPNDPMWWGPAYGGTGGRGGEWGQSGWSGEDGWAEGASAYTGPGGAGGAAGRSVDGNAYITWVATGTRTGPIT